MVKLSAYSSDDLLGLDEVEYPGIGGEPTFDLHNHVVVVSVQRLALAPERREMGGGKAQNVPLKGDAVCSRGRTADGGQKAK